MNRKRLYQTLTINRKIFPLLAAFTFLSLLTESYTYLGFLRQYILIDSRMLLILSFCSASLAYFAKHLHLNNRRKAFFSEVVLLRLNILACPVVVILYLAMEIFEARHFVNYIFSTFHFQPANFFYLMVFSGGLVILSLLNKSDVIPPKSHNLTNESVSDLKSKIFLLLIISLLVFYLLENASLSLRDAISLNVYTLTHLQANYDDKMRVEWKFYYDYMKFINQYTAQDHTAVIATPPTEAPWLTSGNSNLSRYFIYPNRLVKGEYDKLPEEYFNYVMIARGSWATPDPDRYNWPKVFVPAEKIWYIDHDTLKVTEVRSDFDPLDPKNKDVWGLIKVDRTRL